MEDDGIILTEEQQNVMDKILRFFDRPAVTNSKKNCILLYSPAGCGKTTIIKKMCKNIPEEDIALTCPTNKAVDVLRKGMKGFSPMTIHKFLSMEFEYDERGNSRMVMSRPIEEQPKKKILVVDECSMIDEDMLANIRKWSQHSMAKVLFLGDERQLPPVGSQKSPVFQFVPDNMKLTLTKNMRAGDNTITFAHSLFRAATLDLSVKIPESWRATSDTVFVVPSKEFLVSEMAARSQIEGETAVILAWRNKTVNEYNEAVRMELFGEESRRCPYMKGEKMMFHQYYYSGGGQAEGAKYATCDTVKVVEVEEGRYFHPWFEETIPAYRLTVTRGCAFDTLYVLHKKYMKKYKEKADVMKEYTKQRAANIPGGSEKAKSREWKKYYQAYEWFLTPISYSYSMTSHKSQASTFDHTAVILGDIMANWTKTDAWKCAYTAVSRSRKTLFILE